MGGALLRSWSIYLCLPHAGASGGDLSGRALPADKRRARVISGYLPTSGLTAARSGGVRRDPAGGAAPSTASAAFSRASVTLWAETGAEPPARSRANLPRGPPPAPAPAGSLREGCAQATLGN